MSMDEMYDGRLPYDDYEPELEDQIMAGLQTDAAGAAELHPQYACRTQRMSVLREELQLSFSQI